MNTDLREELSKPVDEQLDRPPARAARYRETRKVTLVGVVVNLVLALVKIVAGVVGNSQALVADGVHSLSDLVSDAVVVFAAREASRDPDHDHPYGHGRIETAATIIVGILLLGTAFGLGYRAIQSLIDVSGLVTPAAITLVIALGSMAAKEGLYHYTRRCGRRISSRLLEANAWHHRSDALSSVIVAIGIGGALAGFVVLDAVGAIIVAMMVAKVGWDLIWQSLQELIDTGLDPAVVRELRRAAADVDGVKHAHTLRSRWMGHSILLDLHIQVGPRISVSEGHRIAEAVRHALLERAPRLADVMVHVDPEEDTDGGPSNALPLRGELIERLRPAWEELGLVERIEGLTLHYLGGKVHVQIVLGPPGPGCEPNTEAEALRVATSADPVVGNVAILERTAPIECIRCLERIGMVQNDPRDKSTSD